MKKYLELVKFEHSIFALPFAFVAAWLAAGGFPGWEKLLWIVLAMAGGRTFGMAMNRLIDREMDGKNPRTLNRPLVAGSILPWQAWVLAIFSAALLSFSAYRLNSLCLRLSPLVLFILAGYSFVKRFSALTHLALGLCYFIIPPAVFLAVNPERALWPAILLGASSALWVSGFDILYALQDMEFDRAHGVHSIPADLGIPKALRISRRLHEMCVILLVALAFQMKLGILFWVGVFAVGALLFYEQSLVEPTDISRVNTAFFTVNGWVGVSLFFFTLMDFWVRR